MSQPVARKTGRDIPAKLDLPAPKRQKERLQAKLEAIQAALNSPNSRITNSTAGTTPEEVIVLDIAGSVQNFLKALAKVEGLNLLHEFEIEEQTPDEDFQRQEKTEKPFDGRLYLLMSNQKAMTQILGYWNQWQNTGKVDHGFAPFKNLFSRLRDVRRWSVEDRLRETGVIEDWQERIDEGYETVAAEIELWFHDQEAGRHGSESFVTSLLDEIAGRVIHRCVIPEISYHAILIEIPIASLPHLSNLKQIKLLQCGAIQYLRPIGQFAAPCLETATLPVEETSETVPPDAVPRAALLDGMPLANHPLLRGRVLVDDPDGWESEYPVAARRHGTAMASLILHGDLEAPRGPLAHRLYARPILRPNNDWQDPPPEESPEGQLFVDVIHRAVRRLFETTGDGPPAAPEVVCINFSVGDRYRAYLDSPSPLARLLDWLSWKYQVLFIVSAGNYATELCVAMKSSDFSSLSDEKKRDHALLAVIEDSRNRRLLSPGESVNALTVGASHHDDHPMRAFPTEIFDIYSGHRLASPLSAHGPGYLGCVKPDVVAPGGRAIYGQKLGGPADKTVLEFKSLSRGPGLRHAGTQAGKATGGSVYSVGSSNSAALVTRLGLQVLDELEALFGSRRDLVGIDKIPMALWIKTLVAHSTDWANSRAPVASVIETKRLRDTLSRLHGFGEVQPERALGCTDYRATALAYGELGKDEAHVHRFPLPASIAGAKLMRRLTLTLAYFTPIDPSSKDYRVAAVKFEPSKDGLLEMDRSHADYNDCKRGTLQHEIIEGDKAVSYIDGKFLTIDVSCREASPGLTMKIPYTMAVSLEVAPGTQIKIYDDIRTRIQQPIKIVPGAG